MEADLNPPFNTELSPCRRWRYTLYRETGRTSNEIVNFIGLNPSTADEVKDDPTIRRCISYATRWGYGGMVMTNLFAFRATDPEDMKRADDPIGPENDYWLQAVAEKSAITVAAWGNGGVYLERAERVASLIEDLQCLRKTGRGQPWHPLYLPQTLTPIPWRPI